MASKVHFPGLNGLRFVAAVFVFLHHVEQHKYWVGITNSWGDSLIDNIGHEARVLFFVLSGFLITFLFLGEHEKTGTINWKNFQMRRLLRLWPVYYLMVIISIFVLPHFIDIKTFNASLEENFVKEIIIYVFMVPNLARLLPPIMGANQFWSVGVQEQFYWIWPLAVRIFIKRFVYFIITLIILKLVVEAFIVGAIDSGALTVSVEKRFGQFLLMWRLFMIEQMAIGAIGAYLFFKYREEFCKVIFHPVTHLFALGVFIVTMFTRLHFIGYTVIEALIAFVLILNISNNPNFRIKLQGARWEYLGNLSFGMYAYHTMCIAITISVLTHFNIHSADYLIFNTLLYGLSFLLSFAISALSYRYLESYFLGLKKKFRPPVKAELRDPNAVVIERSQILVTGPDVAIETPGVVPIKDLKK